MNDTTATGYFVLLILVAMAFWYAYATIGGIYLPLAVITVLLIALNVALYGNVKVT